MKQIRANRYNQALESAPFSLKIGLFKGDSLFKGFYRLVLWTEVMALL